jgi:hypothetical protein
MLLGVFQAHDPEDDSDWPEDRPEAGDQAEYSGVVRGQRLAVLVRN